jgi:hypothetical protein
MVEFVLPISVMLLNLATPYINPRQEVHPLCTP